METLESSKSSRVPWSFDGPESVLYDPSMDGEWEHSQFYEEES